MMLALRISAGRAAAELLLPAVAVATDLPPAEVPSRRPGGAVLPAASGNASNQKTSCQEGPCPRLLGGSGTCTVRAPVFELPPTQPPRGEELLVSAAALTRFGDRAISKVQGHSERSSSSGMAAAASSKAAALLLRRKIATGEAGAKGTGKRCCPPLGDGGALPPLAAPCASS